MTACDTGARRLWPAQDAVAGRLVLGRFRSDADALAVVSVGALALMPMAVIDDNLPEASTVVVELMFALTVVGTDAADAIASLAFEASSNVWFATSVVPLLLALRCTDSFVNSRPWP